MQALIRCPKCNSIEIEEKEEKYRCKKCGHKFSQEDIEDSSSLDLTRRKDNYREWR